MLLCAFVLKAGYRGVGLIHKRVSWNVVLPWERSMHKIEKFETFYFRNVGLGEACGCAERIIDAHEFERKAREKRPLEARRRGWVSALRRFGILPRGVHNS